MAAITLAQAQTQLSAWLAADAALAGGAQSYTIGTRTFTRANALEIRNNVIHWQQQVNALNRGGMRVRYGVVG